MVATVAFSITGYYCDASNTKVAHAAAALTFTRATGTGTLTAMPMQSQPDGSFAAQATYSDVAESVSVHVSDGTLVGDSATFVTKGLLTTVSSLLDSFMLRYGFVLLL